MPKVIVLEGVANLSWPSSVDSALGAWIATHNPGHLNVSTAPLAIVEAALREVGRGGIDEIAAARAEGRRVPVPNAAAGAQDDEKHGPDFVSSSDAWAFRVDARVGHVHRSQWLQYRPQESRWRCVQRLLITSG